MPLSFDSLETGYMLLFKPFDVQIHLKEMLLGAGWYGIVHNFTFLADSRAERVMLS